MKIISIQVYVEGICISHTTAHRAKVYFEDGTIRFFQSWCINHVRICNDLNLFLSN